MTIADAGLAYVNRPGGLKPYDFWRVGQLNDVIGDYPLARAAEAWAEFKRLALRAAWRPPRSSAFGRFFRPRLTMPAPKTNRGAEDSDAPNAFKQADPISCQRTRNSPCWRATRRMSGRSPRPCVGRVCGLVRRLRLDWRDVNWSWQQLVYRRHQDRAATIRHPAPQVRADPP